jgi:primase-polymerase (primpol)-like protein
MSFCVRLAIWLRHFPQLPKRIQSGVLLTRVGSGTELDQPGRRHGYCEFYGTSCANGP